jgi:sugar O-acyltransferase (sialic acid O-acetyltransferase NeuD family)
LNNSTYLIGLDEELLYLAKSCQLSFDGIIDNKETGKWNNLNIYSEKKSIIKDLGILRIVLGIDDPFKKEKLDKWYSKNNIEIVSIIKNELHPSCKYEPGLITQMHSFLSINCRIGRCVKINVGATIMHDVTIGDYVTVAPRAVLLGRVKIGKNVFIGANATILPDIVIGDNSIIGAGAVVTKNVPKGVIAKGVPAVFVKKNNIFYNV